MTLWKKTSSSVDDWVIRFTVGDDYQWDHLLLPFDIVATAAHARGLQAAGLISEEELVEITGTLDDLSDEYRKGNVTVSVEDEDCHTVIENYLTTRLPSIGQKIHAGRSRNDQVLAALRLYLREAVRDLVTEVVSLLEALCLTVESKDDWIMPGYTHTRPAMPSTVGLWAAGFAEVLADDLQQLAFLSKLVDRSPLGSAAGFGVPHFRLPRQTVSDELLFHSLQVNATAVQLSRGKNEWRIADACLHVAHTLNRIASDLIRYSSPEFGFIVLPERFCTGSSVMPHKRNPDVLEIVRASYHRIGSEVQLLRSIASNLSTGYHRDLQLAKGAVMRTVSTATDCARATRLVWTDLQFDRSSMEHAITKEMLSTAHANRLVQTGMPFREAYRAAADEMDEIEIGSPSEILSAYGVSGDPGYSSVKYARIAIANVTSDTVDKSA